MTPATARMGNGVASGQLNENDNVGDVGSACANTSRVLIVDDSALQRKILRTSLERWGYSVVEASSGEEALDHCRDELPDVVLSDWVMPGMSGLDFCAKFREMTAERYGYFILLTSKADKDSVTRGLQSGADDYLTKPVNSYELRARIDAGQRILRMQRELSEKNALISDTLAEMQGLYASLDSDLIEARKLQQSLVPERFHEFPEGSLALLMRPAGRVGGDLVGYFAAGPDHIGVFAIDVSGHGISAALMTARLAGYLSAVAPDHNVALLRNRDGTYRPRPPVETVEALNNLVLDEMETEHYFTILLACINLADGKVSVTQAGHPHPLILRADGTTETHGIGGFPVGLISDITFEDFELSLAKGDRLVITSDGITECPGHDGEMLDDAGLASLVARNASVETREFFEALMWDLTDYADTITLPDDVSGVVFEFQGR